MDSTFRISADDLQALNLDGAFGEKARKEQLDRKAKDSLTNNFNDVKKLLLEKRYEPGFKDVFDYFKMIAEIFLLPGPQKIDEIYKILYSFLGSNPKNNAYECMTNYCKCIKSHYDYFKIRDEMLQKNEKSKKDYSELGIALINSYCDAFELAGKYIGCLNCFLDLKYENACSIKKNNSMKAFNKIEKFKKKGIYPELMDGIDNKLRNAQNHGNLIFACETMEFILKNTDGSINKIHYFKMIKEYYNKVISFDFAFIIASKLMAVYFKDIEKFIQLIDMIGDE